MTFSPHRKGHFFYVTFFYVIFPVMTSFLMSFFPIGKVFSSNIFSWTKNQKTPPSKVFSDFCLEKITKKTPFCVPSDDFSKTPNKPGEQKKMAPGGRFSPSLVVKKISLTVRPKMDFLLTRFLQWKKTHYPPQNLAWIPNHGLSIICQPER